jgi:hypothetical protein
LIYATRQALIESSDELLPILSILESSRAKIKEFSAREGF